MKRYTQLTNEERYHIYTILLSATFRSDDRHAPVLVTKRRLRSNVLRNLHKRASVKTREDQVAAGDDTLALTSGNIQSRYWNTL